MIAVAQPGVQKHGRSALPCYSVRCAVIGSHSREGRSEGLRDDLTGGAPREYLDLPWGVDEYVPAQGTGGELGSYVSRSQRKY